MSVPASVLGHSYDCFVGTVSDISEDSMEPDFNVNVEKFLTWLNSALSASQ
jgi:hypothetical protein